MEPTQSSETSAYILRTPEKFPKEYLLNIDLFNLINFRSNYLRNNKLTHAQPDVLERGLKVSKCVTVGGQREPSATRMPA